MPGFENEEQHRQHHSLRSEKRSLILINGRPQYILPVITTDVLYLCSKLVKPLKSLVRAYLQVNNLSGEGAVFVTSVNDLFHIEKDCNDWDSTTLICKNLLVLYFLHLISTSLLFFFNRC